MLSEQVVSSPIISQEDLFCRNIDQFIQVYRPILDLNIVKGMNLNFSLPISLNHRRVSPIIQLARPEDAKELVAICKEVYDGTYPYKEMEDEEYIRKKIEDPQYHILLFKDKMDTTLGCFKCILDFEQKKGYMGGFMLRKQFQKSIDVVKAIVGSYVWMWTTFKDRIFIWYCENRTSQSTSQFMTSVCGIKTVSFLPNKDIFCNEIESDVLGVVYVEKALKKYRSKEIPRVIPSAVNCYQFSRKHYPLEGCSVEDPQLIFDLPLLKNLKMKLKMNIKPISFGGKVIYKEITLYYEDSESYFKFLYTPQIQNFEKTEYQVSNLEELFIFVSNFIEIAKDMDVRYVEVFASAYEPTQQKIFYTFGLIPRGYVPCWRYNKRLDRFEDYIVFNSYIGTLSKNLQLIREGVELFEVLDIGSSNFNNDYPCSSQFS
jgi:hypothetical protein